MESPKSVQSGDDDEHNGAGSNFNVDYVIHYRVPKDERADAEAAYVQLIEALTAVGLATEVRPCDDSSLLVFAKMASSKLLREQVYRSRLQDWLQGVRTVGPTNDLGATLMEEPVSEAERLRLVYLSIIRSRNEGGAGVTPGKGQWKYVAGVFPLHDRAFNRRWIKAMSTKYLLTGEDLDEIRGRFGESVAMYFAFVQSYFRFLVFPAAFGLGLWTLLGTAGAQFSALYALGTGLWGVVFFEHWKAKEVDLAVQWGVRGVSRIQMPRPEFKPDREVADGVTGEAVSVYSPFKRLATQALQVPFVILCLVVLGGFIVTCNSLEVFINEVYTGPFKTYLPFLPTILLVTVLPTFSSVLTKFAAKLTDMENYKTRDAYHSAMVQKEFVVNFITSYMPLSFTAFVYTPFGHILRPYLDVWATVARTLAPSSVGGSTDEAKAQDMFGGAEDFRVNPARIANQMFYFTVTAQVVSLATEVVVPFLKRRVTREVKERGIVGKASNVGAGDAKEEAKFLERVRREVELEDYDVTTDYREMVIQFGLLSLFSVAWPLAGCGFLINNWVEMRSDAVKIAAGSRRPTPWRADSIGPWLDALGFLSWLGSLTSAAIIFLCRDASSVAGDADVGDGTVASLEPGPRKVAAWGVLLAVFFAEHLYLVVKMVVRNVMERMESPGLQRVRRERYVLKRRMLEEKLGEGVEVGGAVRPGVEVGEKLTAEALGGSWVGTPEDMFWQRQQGMAGTVEAGRELMAAQASKAG